MNIVQQKAEEWSPGDSFNSKSMWYTISTEIHEKNVDT